MKALKFLFKAQFSWFEVIAILAIVSFVNNILIGLVLCLVVGMLAGFVNGMLKEI